MDIGVVLLYWLGQGLVGLCLFFGMLYMLAVLEKRCGKELTHTIVFFCIAFLFFKIFI